MEDKSKQTEDSSLVHHKQTLQATSKNQHQIPQRKHQVGKRSKISGNGHRQESDSKAACGVRE